MAVGLSVDVKREGRCVFVDAAFHTADKWVVCWAEEVLLSEASETRL